MTLGVYGSTCKVIYSDQVYGNTMLVTCVFLIVAFPIMLYQWVSRQISKFIGGSIPPKKRVLTLYHPHITQFGGGERVIWSMVIGWLKLPGIEKVYIQSCFPNMGDSTVSELLKRAEETFQIKGLVNERNRIHIQPIVCSFLLEKNGKPVLVPFARLLVTALRHMICYTLTCAFGSAPTPTHLVEVASCPLVYPVASAIHGAQVTPYVNYPLVIPSRVCETVQRGSLPFRLLKRVGYSALVALYRWSGTFASRFGYAANSTWVMKLMADIWPSRKCEIVYPPVPTLPQKKLLTIDKSVDSERRNVIVSLGQLRPEKNHMRQIRIFAQVRKSVPDAQLYIIGGGYDEDYANRVMKYPDEFEPGLSGSVKFFRNVPRAEMLRLMKHAKCALHTMVEEHFGIALIEIIQELVPMVCHNSGGPKEDTLAPTAEGPTGFLADTDDEFAEKLVYCLKTFPSLSSMRLRAYNSLFKFHSDESFATHMVRLMHLN